MRVKVPKELARGSGKILLGTAVGSEERVGAVEPKRVANGTLQRNLSPPLRSACGSFVRKETEGELGKELNKFNALQTTSN